MGDAAQIEFVFQLDHQLGHPVEVGHSLEALEHQNGFFELCEVVFAKATLEDGEIWL